MRSLIQAFQAAAFALTEYIRSGRILIEVAASIICTLLFFRPSGSPPTPDYFFSISATFTLALAIYTASAIFSLGDRQPSYIPLMHGLSRSGFLLGLYLSIVGVVSATFGILSLAIAVVNPVGGLDVRSWLLGTAPLVLNVALVAALLTLLAPMVLSAGWRLLSLALLAIAFSGNLLSGQTVEAMPVQLATVLSVLRTIFSAPLLPLFTGFALTVTRDYSHGGWATPLSQIILTAALLVAALAIFARRELLFQN